MCERVRLPGDVDTMAYEEVWHDAMGGMNQPGFGYVGPDWWEVSLDFEHAERFVAALHAAGYTGAHIYDEVEEGDA